MQRRRNKGCRWAKNSEGADDWVSKQRRGRGTWSLSENITDIAQDYDVIKERLILAPLSTLTYDNTIITASRDLSEN